MLTRSPRGFVRSIACIFELSASVAGADIEVSVIHCRLRAKHNGGLTFELLHCCRWEGIYLTPSMLRKGAFKHVAKKVPVCR